MTARTRPDAGDQPVIPFLCTVSQPANVMRKFGIVHRLRVPPVCRCGWLDGRVASVRLKLTDSKSAPETAFEDQQELVERNHTSVLISADSKTDDNKKLGASLTAQAAVAPSTSVYPDLVPTPSVPPHIQQTLEKVNAMSYRELRMQKFLDADRPFLSTKAEGALMRKNLIRDLPATIDLFDDTKADADSGVYPTNTFEDVARIYSDLAQLDTDETVYNKYYDRYNILRGDTNDIMQGFNGIAEKFQLVRRGESFNLPLSPNHYRFEVNLFNMPYNVPGFDVSLLGMPLRFGGQMYTSRQLPLELVKDLRAFDKTVALHKRDLDFETDQQKKMKEESTTIHPEVDTMGLVQKVKVIEQDCIELQHHSLDDYRPFPIPQWSPTIKYLGLFEYLVTSLQKKLVQEIEEFFGGTYRSPDTLFRTNLFYLFEKKKPKILQLWNRKGATEISLPIQLVRLSGLPLSSYQIKTRKERRFLRLQLFKIYRINVEGLIDRLITMKYQTERAKNLFLKKTFEKMYHDIDNELLAQVIKDCTVPKLKLMLRHDGREAEVIMFTPFQNGSFKRAIWTKQGWGSLKHHQRSKMPTVTIRKVQLEVCAR